MRATIPLSLLFLFIALLLNLESGVYDELLPKPAATERSIAGSSVRIFSTGGALAPERFLRQKYPQGIVVNGELLGRGRQAGLYGASFLAAGGDVQAFWLDSISSDDDVRALGELVASAPVDTVLALSTLTTLAPPQDQAGLARRRALASALELLGVRSHPESDPGASWAFLALRRPQGWVPLAESHSATKGVSLALLLSPDLAVYDDFDPLLIEDDRVEQRLVDLFSLATVHGFSDVRTDQSYHEVNRVLNDAILASPLHGPQAVDDERPNVHNMLFPYVRLGPAAVFATQLGMASWRRKSTNGVRFEILVNGESHAFRDIDIDPGEPDAWLPWSVDLSHLEGQWIALELRVTRLGYGPDERPSRIEPFFWGDPRIITVPGAAREPTPPSLRESVLSVTDRNADGLISRAEVRQALLSFDTNGDGTLTGDEAPSEAPWLVEAVDVDGDGSASEAEMASWYDRIDETSPWKRPR